MNNLAKKYENTGYLIGGICGTALSFYTTYKINCCMHEKYIASALLLPIIVPISILISPIVLNAIDECIQS
jgi:hypothetical protein